MKTRFLSCALLLHCSSNSMNQAQQGTGKYGSLQPKAPLVQKQRSNHPASVDLVIRTQSPGGRTHVHCISPRAYQR